MEESEIERLSSQDYNEDDIKYDECYIPQGRSFLCGVGALKWYFCEFKCDSSHRTFSIYLLVLLAVWGIYVAAFHFDHFFYSMLAGCLLGVLMAMYAIPKIRDLAEMRKALRALVKSNISLREHHTKVSGHVNSVNTAHNKLNKIQSSITDSNSKLKQSYTEFNEYGNALNQRNVQNIEHLKRLQYHFAECRQNYEALLMRAERATLNALYRQIHQSDGKPGLSKAEFDAFLAKLPKHYQRRFMPFDQTFSKYAGEDENMDYREFQIMITNVARHEALDADA